MVEGPHCSRLLAFFVPSMETLSDMFELDLPTVHSIISKMIINEELMVRAISMGTWAGGVMKRLEYRRLICPFLRLTCVRPPWTSRHRQW